MRLKIVAAIVAIGVYFALAYYFKISYVEDVPRRDDVAKIMRLLPTATPGTFYAQVWVPTWVTRATVYENGVSIGQANAVYDDPGRTWVFVGRRWKMVEFDTRGSPALRWVVFDGKEGEH